MKKNKKSPKMNMKTLSNIFSNELTLKPMMQYSPNFTETEKIYWYHFVRQTRSSYNKLQYKLIPKT